MAWRDLLHPASFRGIGFKVLSGTLSAGRRLARHEYPQRDEPWIEDMGRRAREYKVEAYIIGPDYMADRDRLLAAVEQSGGGQLVHPYHGTKVVTVTECELSESTEFGGMAKFGMTFVEAGEQAQPTVGIDSSAQLVNAQERAFAAIQDDFASSFSIAKLPSWGVGDIESTIVGFTNLNDFQSIASSTASFSSGLSDLLALPGSLASRVIGLVRSLSSVTDILSQPYLPRSASAGTATRGVVQRQQSAVTVLMKRAALVQQAGILSNADLATNADVQAARAALLSEFDAHDYAVGNPRPSAAVATELKAVRSAALAHLSRQSASLPQTYSLRLIESQPALALSYALYGDLRNADIVRRNAIRHPGFVPAGTSLQLTTE